MGKVTVVGIGPGSYEDMTIRADTALRACDAIVGYPVYVDLVRDRYPGKELHSTPMTREAERCQLALELARMHIHSTIIERDPARCRVMKTLLPEATIICADGTKPDVLREEGLPEADALVTLTESDETNLIISSFAYHEQVPKIVTKVDEDNFIELAESYGLTTIIQPADVTAGRIVEYVRWMQNSAHSSGVETLRMDADAIAMAGTHEVLLQRFARERIPIMIGTQMITKGLNFENVTLVGVLNADQSLYVGAGLPRT